ncbi:lipopolysaccharide biosynthesis protein [Variovorax paradoxus]|uniref:lipopolysaccharide biosynthesis protein n=1 Tax=Variovorax paradoxus TaxID=34073 RepID=UPI002854F8A1|nr:oligosaccharide flippase family protein [Variovorax paradoxus]MDR6453091.1 O-antigen/teichoic acid export membrane protein [Variovorax paradoxus]
MPEIFGSNEGQIATDPRGAQRTLRGPGSGYVTVIAGMCFRAAFQAALTILLARLLGRADYGALVVVGGIAGLFSILAGLGASALHLRDTAIAPDAWRDSFVAHHASIWKTQPILLASAVLVAWLVAREEVGWLSLLLLIFGDLLGAPASDLLVRSCQGRERYGRMALAMCALPLTRVLLVTPVAMTSDFVSLQSWSLLSFLSGAAIAAVAAGMAMSVKNDNLIGRKYSRDSFSGLGFSMTAASARIHADADKAIIAKLSSFGAAGEYSLAYRMMDVLLLPINGLIEWSMRALFRHGRGGIAVSLRALWRRWLILLSLALGACVAAYALAPFLPAIFGEQFQDAVLMGRWLALLPLTTACWVMLRSIVATAGHQKFVGVVELIGASVSILLGIVLVLQYGWRGAVVATYGTHIAMSLAVIGGAILKLRHPPEQ